MSRPKRRRLRRKNTQLETRGLEPATFLHEEDWSSEDTPACLQLGDTRLNVFFPFVLSPLSSETYVANRTVPRHHNEW